MILLTTHRILSPPKHPLAATIGEQMANLIGLGMARRPELRNDEALTRDDLKTIAHRLALLNEGAVLDFYKRAHRECEIINSRTFPPPSNPRTGSSVETAQQVAKVMGSFVTTVAEPSPSDAGTLPQLPS